MNTLARRFAQHWQEKRFPRQGTMLLALSGGLDSMVLANLLLAADVSFAAAHCHFSLRAEADDDASFVAQWCRDHGIVCHVTQFDTSIIAQQQRQSIQMTARSLRYEWFEALRKQHGYAAILTAHHADDVAETMLINLCRGAGIAGLHGIPERHGSLIRPLLFARRADVLAYAAEHALQWREDASNAEEKYLRNAFRLRVVPLLETLMPGAAGRIAETAERLRGTEQILRKEVNWRLAHLTEQRGQDTYIALRLLEKQEALAAIAFELFHPLGFSAEQMPQILDLMHAESGRYLSSQTHRVIRHRDFLVITSSEQEEADLLFIETLPANIQTSEGTISLEWTDPPAGIPDDPNMAMLHGDALTLPLVLRKRREGDYFYPLGMGMKKKKLKRFLIDQKLSLHEKDRILLLEHQGRILWVAGHRIDERFRLRPSTKKVLKAVFQPKK